MHIQSLVKFCHFHVKLLNGNEILTSIKGHNSATNLRNMTSNNPNLDIFNMNAYIKFSKIQLIFSQDIERKGNSDINQWT